MRRWKQEVGKEARTGERHSKAGWQAGPSELVLSTKGSEDLPEPQVDPIFRLQHKFSNGHWDTRGIWCQFKSKGHSHIQLIRGKLLPEEVPGSGWEKEVSRGF